MRLRRQLFIVSLLTLCLPWAGCQYIREMENVLRDEKAATLRATAQAVAAHLASEPNLFDSHAYDAQWFAERDIRSLQLYLHPLRREPSLDARDGEWTDLGIEPVELRHESTPEFSAHVYSGLYDETVYLFFRVFDSNWQPHNPQRDPGIANGDHIILRTNQRGLGIQDYYLRTSVSGNMTARYVNSYGSIRNEPRIYGHWRITSAGYQVEVQVPRSVAGDELSYAIVNKINASSTPSSGKISLGPLTIREMPLPWVSRNDGIKKILREYGGSNQTLAVANRGHWLLAQEGKLSSVNPMEQAPATATQHLPLWIYKLALGSNHYPPLVDAATTGFVEAEELLAALDNQVAVNWYSSNDAQLVGRAAVPISVGGQIVGAVLVAESTDEILSATQAAFTDLFTYTLGAAAVAVIGLVAFASLLSFRIRRLSKAADSAIAEDGRINNEVLQANFLNSKAKDEVGDLTRSYGSLLTRVREYTEYLRTLSSKLSHELRTPLAVVRSSLDNVEKQKLDGETQRYLERAEDGLSRLSNILSAMSAASHMEQSIKSSVLERFNLATLLRDVTVAYRDTYSRVNIDCRIDGETEDFAWRGSPDLIVQMLDKLVDNAADFSSGNSGDNFPGGNGQIELSLARETADLVLSVTNTGPLLPRHMQGQLFDSLVSVREHAKREGESSHLGLGLYIVRLVVEFHGGRVSAHNLEDGSGVCFTVRLPLEPRNQ